MLHIQFAGSPFSCYFISSVQSYSSRGVRHCRYTILSFVHVLRGAAEVHAAAQPAAQHTTVDEHASRRFGQPRRKFLVLYKFMQSSIKPCDAPSMSWFVLLPVDRYCYSTCCSSHTIGLTTSRLLLHANLLVQIKPLAGLLCQSGAVPGEVCINSSRHSSAVE